MASGRYRYQPLDPQKRQFRLLDVQPSREEREWIRCSLRHVSLEVEAKPEYETVSYAWGDSNARVPLQLNGSSLSVPRSSATALRRMRLSDRVRTLWIDAVCIDQDNVVEREQQVAMMGDLYRSSKGNLVYLGEGDKGERRSRRDIQMVLDDMHEGTQGKGLRHVLDNDEPTSGFAKAVNFDRLAFFYERPWFSRLWVFQEAALAPSNTCHLGVHSFDLLSVVRAARWLMHKYLYIPSFLSDCLGCVKAAKMFDFMDKENGSFRNSEPSFRELLLDIATGMKARDAKDLVFGVLGLKQWQTRIPRLLYPDYNKSVREVHRDAARFILSELYEDSDLADCWDPISLQSDQRLDSDDYLSWVPDFTHIWDDDVDPNYPSSLGWLWDCAAGEKQDQSSLSQLEPADPNVFPVSGFALDTIVQVAPEPQKMISRAKSWALWLEETIPLMQVPEDQARLILIAEGSDDAEKVSDEGLQGYGHFRTMLQQDKLPPWTESRTSYASITEPETLSALRYFAALKAACRHRKVFRTTDGHVGIGPKVTEKGDAVVVIWGSSKPVVLRPRGKDFRLLGTAYVHGIMEGEATQRHKEQDLPETVFRLR